MTVNQALAHPWLRNVRDHSAEVSHERLKFDFEDIPLKIRTIKSLVIDELMKWSTGRNELSQKLQKSKQPDEDDEKSDIRLVDKQSGNDEWQTRTVVDKDG